MPAIPDETFTDLIEAIARIRGFFETSSDVDRLSPSEIRTLERLLEDYQRADEAFGGRIEGTIKQSALRPHR